LKRVEGVRNLQAVRMWSGNPQVDRCAMYLGHLQ
jgi:hypothetical protein